MSIKEKILDEFRGKTFSSNEDVMAWLSSAIDQIYDDLEKKIDNWNTFCCGHNNKEHLKNDCPGWSIEDDRARKVVLSQIKSLIKSKR